jgi:hypothetical protein
MPAADPHLSAQFTLLLDTLTGTLATDEREEIAEILAHAEYALALESLWAILLERRQPIPRVAHTQMLALADALGIRAEIDTDSLRRLVADTPA